MRKKIFLFHFSSYVFINTNIVARNPILFNILHLGRSISQKKFPWIIWASSHLAIRVLIAHYRGTDWRQSNANSAKSFTATWTGNTVAIFSFFIQMLPPVRINIAVLAHPPASHPSHFSCPARQNIDVLICPTAPHPDAQGTLWQQVHKIA